jgi:hypothetical protein
MGLVHAVDYTTTHVVYATTKVKKLQQMQNDVSRSQMPEI